MNKKFVEKFTAVVSAVCMISVGIASVNAAEINDGFESVTKNAQSSDSSFPSAYSAIGYSLVDENGLPSNFSSKNLGFVHLSRLSSITIVGRLQAQKALKQSS